MIRPGDPEPDEPPDDDDPKTWGISNYPPHIPMGLPLPPKLSPPAEDDS